MENEEKGTEQKEKLETNQKVGLGGQQENREQEAQGVGRSV